jgi:hypothetical protein
MSRFGMIVEDPTYNEEGQLDDIDDWLSARIDTPEVEEIMGLDIISYDPHDTVNS